MGFKNLKYGFTYIVIDKVERPYCLNCNGLYLNDLCKPGRLKDILKPNTRIAKTKHYYIMKLKRERTKKEKKHSKKVKIIPEEKFICCSYTMARYIALFKRLYSDGENFFSNTFSSIINILFPEKNEFMTAFQKIKLSQMTIKRKTVELYLDIKKQLRKKLKTSIMGLFSI